MVRWVAVFVALLVLIFTGVAVWRLSAGPVRLDFLTPYIEKALSRPEQGLEVDIAETLLAWGEWPHPIGLYVRGVRVRQSPQATPIELHDVSFGLNTRALLRGAIVPSRIGVTGAHLHLLRSPDGHFALESSGESADPDSENFWGSVFGNLLLEPDYRRPLSLIDEVSIEDGRLVLDDRRLKIVLVAAPATIRLQRNPTGVTGAAELTIVLGDRTARVDATARYKRATNVIDVTASFSDLATSAAAVAAPQLTGLPDLDVTLDGSLQLSISTDGLPRSAHFEIASGPGKLDFPDLLGAARPIRELKLRGDFDGHRLDVALASLTLGAPDEAGPKLSATGVVRRLPPQGNAAEAVVLDVAARLSAAEVRADDLPLYWPRGFGDSARQWVDENVRSGRVSEAVMDIALTAPSNNPTAAKLTRLDGTLRYDDLEVHYLGSLPAGTALSGTGRFDRSSLRFDISSGSVGGLQMGDSAVDILGLGSDEDRMVIGAQGVGPLRSVLALLRLLRPGLLEALTIDPAKGDRQGRVRVDVRFPLRHGLTFGNVEIGARAELSDIMMDSAFVTGPVGVSWRFDSKPDGSGRSEGTVNLQQARLALPFLHWEKPAGTPGQAQLSLRLARGRAMDLDKLEVEAGTLRAQGSARFDASGQRLESIELHDLVFDESSLKKATARWRDGGLAVEVGDGVLNAAPFLDRASKQESATALPSFSLSAPHVGKLVFAQGRFLEDVTVRLERSREGWEAIRIEAAVPGSLGSSSGASGATRGTAVPRKKVAFDFQPSGPGSHRLQARTDDVGAVLRILGISSTVRGGRLEVAGETDPSAPGAPLHARIEAHDYGLAGQSWVLRLLTMASVRGLLAAPTSDVIRFEHLVGDIGLEGDLATINRWRSHGSALGLTVEGSIDLARTTADLQGTIVPIYTANRIVNSIPVLSNLWGAVGAENFLAVAYDIEGDLSNPNIRINALRTLEPRFVRGLFEILD